MPSCWVGKSTMGAQHRALPQRPQVPGANTYSVRMVRTHTKSRWYMWYFQLVLLLVTDCTSSSQRPTWMLGALKVRGQGLEQTGVPYSLAIIAAMCIPWGLLPHGGAWQPLAKPGRPAAPSARLPNAIKSHFVHVQNTCSFCTKKGSALYMQNRAFYNIGEAAGLTRSCRNPTPPKVVRAPRVPATP